MRAWMGILAALFILILAVPSVAAMHGNETRIRSSAEALQPELPQLDLLYLDDAAASTADFGTDVAGAWERAVRDRSAARAEPAVDTSHDAEGVVGSTPAENWHAPIQIVGDEDFASPNSGVRNPEAAGTADDPYIIENWIVNPWTLGHGHETKWCRSQTDKVSEPSWWPTAGDTDLGRVPEGTSWHAIEIRDTSAHVVIRDVTIRPVRESSSLAQEAVLAQQGTSDGLIGIFLKNADNVRIESNHIHGVQNGPELFRGICAKQADNLEIAQNTVERTEYTSVELEDAPGAGVTRNTIRHSSGWDDEFNQADGIRLKDGPRTAIQNNTIRNQTSTNLWIEGSSQTLIDNNTLAESKWGILTVESDFTKATYNNIRVHDETGIRLSGTSHFSAHWNNIYNNRYYGLDAQDWTWAKVAAQNNWWGCPDGPDDQACDDVIGDFHDEVNTSSYESWPIRAAGPDGSTGSTGTTAQPWSPDDSTETEGTDTGTTSTDTDADTSTDTATDTSDTVETDTSTDSDDLSTDDSTTDTTDDSTSSTTSDSDDEDTTTSDDTSLLDLFGSDTEV